MKILIFLFVLLMNNLLLAAQFVENPVPIYEKSKFFIGYDLGIKPKVGRFLNTTKTTSLAGLHRITVGSEFPFFKYLSAGFSLNYTMVRTNKYRNPNLNISKDSSKLTQNFLGVLAEITPQINIFDNNSWDITILSKIKAGIGTSSPIFMGTEPSSDYEYNLTRQIPSPFPFYFEGEPSAGLQISFKKFISLNILAGYRYIQVVHPFVTIEKKDQNPDMTDEKKKFHTYDISAFILQGMVSFAF